MSFVYDLFGYKLSLDCECLLCVQVTELLRSKSFRKNEGLEAQQQMSLFQDRLREQNAHLEILREKAHDLEVQLESSQKVKTYIFLLNYFNFGGNSNLL